MCFINAFQLRRRVPQGLKPAFFQALNGTAEAVPYPKPIYETCSKHSGKEVGPWTTSVLFAFQLFPVRYSLFAVRRSLIANDE